MRTLTAYYIGGLAAQVEWLGPMVSAGIHRTRQEYSCSVFAP